MFLAKVAKGDLIKRKASSNKKSAVSTTANMLAYSLLQGPRMDAMGQVYFIIIDIILGPSPNFKGRIFSCVNYSFWGLYENQTPNKFLIFLTH